MGVVRAASTPTGVSTRAQLSILGGEGVRDPQKVPGCAGFWLQPGTASAACIPLPRHPKPQKFPKLPSPEVAPGGQTASGTVRKSFATFQDWPPEVGLFSWEKGCPRPFLVGGRGEGVSGVTERERERRIRPGQLEVLVPPGTLKSRHRKCPLPERGGTRL